MPPPFGTQPTTAEQATESNRLKRAIPNRSEPNPIRRRSSSKSRSASPPQPPPQEEEGERTASGAGSPARTAEEEMERVFREFDANGDGRISLPELAVLFESLGHAATDDELSRMMAEADADGDGFSSLEEFAVLNATAAGDDEEDLRLAFNVFDADGSGAISAAELAGVLLPAKCLRAALLLPAPALARAPGPKPLRVGFDSDKGRNTIDVKES